MTDTTEKRADSTRQQILRAAAHRFAQRAYHDVGLDDILAEAALTKGAMYFHFPSKHALALAVIEEQITAGTAAIQELLARKLSGLETVIEFAYLIAVQDITRDLARAALYLLMSVDRTEGPRAGLLGGWVQTVASVIRRAITEGDVTEQCDPQDVGRFLVSLHMGMRQTGSLDEPEQFLHDLEKSWVLVLRSIVPPDRIDYFTQFIERRTAIAIRATSTHKDPD